MTNQSNFKSYSYLQFGDAKLCFAWLQKSDLLIAQWRGEFEIYPVELLRCSDDSAPFGGTGYQFAGVLQPSELEAYDANLRLVRAEFPTWKLKQFQLNPKQEEKASAPIPQRKDKETMLRLAPAKQEVKQEKPASTSELDSLFTADEIQLLKKLLNKF